MKYVESINQLADILTKGSFTRDEWNHLLHLFNNMNNTTFTRSHFFLSNGKQAVMSKRSQECFSTDDSPTVKARSRTLNLVSQQCLSARQSSWTSNPATPGSTGTESVCHPALGNHCLKALQKFQCWALKLMADGCACRERCGSDSVVVCTVR